MTNIFYRKKLLTERKSKNKYKCIGYARATSIDNESLNDQIQLLGNFGCNYIFSESIALDQDPKPQFEQAINNLSRGDKIVFTKLDRAFRSQYECISIINNLLNKGINFATVSGSINSNNNFDIYKFIFNILFELETLENDILLDKKKRLASNILIDRKNVGGRPKIGHLKEKLVIRLRKEGFSYRSIRSQTGIALSTIRRIILDYAEVS